MKGREVVALVLVAVLLAAGHLGSVDCQQLSATFYASSCANVDTIVRNTVQSAMNQSQVVGPSVLRLFAHDCFVKGCDGSILLEDSPANPAVEREDTENLSLQQMAFDTINQIKQAVEAQCPGVVSCADILSMAAQDAVNFMGGPSWPVLLGRRDGLNSSATSVAGQLPGADMTVSQLSGIFGGIGLATQDLVALSGAHTVGFAHCKEFADRLYNFNVSGAVDPSLSVNYIGTLQGKCPNGTFSNSSVQALDPQTTGQFDNLYYQQLQIGQGLLFSDQVLFVDNTTTNLVTTYANNQAQFFTDFVSSMIAMSQVGVLTGTQGEIRTNCSAVNGSPTSGTPSNSSAPVPVSSPPAPTTASPLPAPAASPPPPTASPPPAPALPSPPPPTSSPPPAPALPSPPPPTPSPSLAPVIQSPPPPTPSPPPSPPPANATQSPPPPTPSPPPSPPPANATQSPPPPANSTQSPPPPNPSLPPPNVIRSPPPPSPPPANVTRSPPPSPPPPVPVTPSPPPPVPVLPSPPPPVPVLPSPPPPVPVLPSPPPPVPVLSSPPPPVPVSSPPPPTRSPPPPPAIPSPPPPTLSAPPTIALPPTPSAPLAPSITSPPPPTSPPSPLPVTPSRPPPPKASRPPPKASAPGSSRRRRLSQ